MPQTKTRANLFIVSGPSGVGKTSLVKAVVASMPNLRLSVSFTTRARRPGEQEGIDYHFVPRERFLDMRAHGDFLECAEVFGNWYGTSKQWVQQQMDTGVDVVLEIDWQGAHQARTHFTDPVTVMVVPPSIDNLESRLRARAQDDDQVIAARMAAASAELAHFADYDYLVINDRFESALADLGSIVRAGQLRTNHCGWQPG